MVLPESGNVHLLTTRENNRWLMAEDMRGRVSELEKNLCKIFGLGLRLKTKPHEGCASSNDRDRKKLPPPSRVRDVPNGKNQDQENGELV
ncbi:hypothetical protein Hanom_Chr00s000004g01606171 [Helianthus anomalus]